MIASPPYAPESFAATRYRSINGIDQLGTVDPLAAQLYRQTGAWTLVAWVRGADPGAAARLFAIGDGAASSPYYLIGDGGTVRSAFGILVHNGTSVVINAKTTATAWDSTWHMVALVDDGGTVHAQVDDGTYELLGSYTRFAWTPSRATIGAWRYGAGPTSLQYLAHDNAGLAWIGRALGHDEISALHAVGPWDLRLARGSYYPSPTSYILHDWMGEGPDTPGRGVNRGIYRGVIEYANTAASDIVLGGP